MMPGRLALTSEASTPRLYVLDGDAAHEVFDVVGVAGDVIRVRSALLFEVGEELAVRIEQDGASWLASARVRAHGGPAGEPISELEITDREPHRVADE